MTHWLNRRLLLALLLIGAAVFWLLLDNSHGAVAPQQLHMADLRRLATSLPGASPQAVEIERVGWRLLSGDLVAAGSGLKRRNLVVAAFRLRFAGGRAVMIDSGLTMAAAHAYALTGTDPAAQARIDTALAAAGTIVLTDEKGLHLAGLLALAARQPPGPGNVLAAARLNPAQLPPSPLATRWGWPATPPPPRSPTRGDDPDAQYL